MTTHVEQVQRIARTYGFEVDDVAASAILWEETGFPSFFQSRGVMRHRELRRQIRAYFRRKRTWECRFVIGGVTVMGALSASTVARRSS